MASMVVHHYSWIMLSWAFFQHLYERSTVVTFIVMVSVWLLYIINGKRKVLRIQWTVCMTWSVFVVFAFFGFPCVSHMKYILLVNNSDTLFAYCMLHNENSIAQQIPILLFLLTFSSVTCCFVNRMLAFELWQLKSYKFHGFASYVALEKSINHGTERMYRNIARTKLLNAWKTDCTIYCKPKSFIMQSCIESTTRFALLVICSASFFSRRLRNIKGMVFNKGSAAQLKTFPISSIF